MKGNHISPPINQRRRLYLNGEEEQVQVSGNLKARSNKKKSATWPKHESALATGEDVPSLARPLPTGPLTKVELEESLQLTNAYANCMEGRGMQFKRSVTRT